MGELCQFYRGGYLFLVAAKLGKALLLLERVCSAGITPGQPGESKFSPLARAHVTSVPGQPQHGAGQLFFDVVEQKALRIPLGSLLVPWGTGTQRSGCILWAQPPPRVRLGATLLTPPTT